MIQDIKNRQFKKLRVSLVGNCNFACAYCVPDKKDRLKKITEDTPPEVFHENIIKIHKLVNLESVRLTGGEPTLYKKLPQLISMLKKSGLPKVSITTNGSRLKKIHKELKDAGLDSINVSLDSIDEKVFQKINRANKISLVLEGINSILMTGIDIKINCTVMKEFNDHQILPILEYAKERKITVRYLELMKMGHLLNSHTKNFYSEDDILKTIQSKYKLVNMGRDKSNTCNYWQIPNEIKVGVISNHSNPFCSDCDRLRIDQKGNIYGCLSVNKSFPIGDDRFLNETLSKAMKLKREKNFSGSTISMQSIGG